MFNTDLANQLVSQINEVAKHVERIDARLVPDAEKRLTQIETQIKPLFNNGQPGLCQVHSDEMLSLRDRLSEHINVETGRRSVLTMFYAAVGSGLTLAVTAFCKWMKWI